MPHQWWNTPTAAWGLLLLGIGVGAVLTYVSPLIGIPIGAIMCLAGIFLIIRAYLSKFKVKISLKKGSNKVLVWVGIVGILVCIGGIVGFGFLIHSQLGINKNVEATIVRCCISDKTYQVAVDNRGNDTDTVSITLKINDPITDFKPIMGASLPNIIEGGKNANFITFKVEQLPPGVQLSYVISTNWEAKQPREFKAWSYVTKNNITTGFTGQCPTFTFGPEEKAP